MGKVIPSPNPCSPRSSPTRSSASNQRDALPLASLAKKAPTFCPKYCGKGRRALIGVIVLLVSITWVTIVCTSLPALAQARNHLDTEQVVSDALQSPKPSQVDTAQEGTAGLIVLPKLGYGPEGGPAIGIKFTGRNLGDTGLTLDLNTIAAWEGQQSYHFNVVHAKFFDGRLISVLNANFFPIRRASISGWAITMSARTPYRRIDCNELAAN
jgi:hypothetical protein